jgi:uncharacterized membrane protein YdjX (TVP38/TMEM64 family)
MKKTIAGISIVALFVGLYWWLSQSGTLAIVMDGAALQERIAQLGLWGPFATISLMTGAIVLSPIPSMPIALAAGAAFGRLWGTIYILIGAELGAIIAFGIARLLGRDVIKRWLGTRLSLGATSSQNSLTAIVLVTRMMPFVSFDVVSYAAGLTPLAAWRFAIATLVGITPISLVLAHFGSEMASGDAQRITIAVSILGGFTLVPVVVKLARDWHRMRAENRRDVPVCV